MRLAIAMLAAMGASLLAGTPKVPEGHWGRNLVPNPGLEIEASGWNLPPGQCAWDAAEKHSGARSLRFTNTDKDVYRLVTASVAAADGRVIATRRSPRQAETQESAYWVVDLPELAVGRYTLAVGLSYLDALRVGEPTRAAFRVAEPVPRKVTLDETGRLIVEGKPFFPLGLYLGPTEDEHLERIAQAGFNAILCYGYGAGKDPRAYLDRAAKHGLKVIYSIKDFYEGSTWHPKQAGMSDLDQMRRHITDLREHPALLAWYTNDELGPEWMPKLQAAYDLVCELDPDHPAFQVLCVPSQNHLYYGVTDILGVDPYPVPRHPVTMVGEWMDTARAATWWAKPAWCVPQVFQWANYSQDAKDREPTFDEKRAMICLALIHGAQGLVCHSYNDLFKGDDKAVFERRWNEVSAIAGEVAKLTPVLLEGREVAADLRSPIRFRALEHNGATSILAVNTSTVPRDARVDLPKAKWTKRLGALESAFDIAE